ncbi:MAG: ATP-binding cassette domain-containing protein [Desulfobacterales bacterium]|nr:MAG: ATP-binding cassette domain-containing protein [Desulfobacterales bacterium]
MSDPQKKQDENAAEKKASESNHTKGRLVFQLNNVTKNWSGEHGFELTIPQLTIRQGEKVALVGFSGCGKSTLLDLLAMILQPDRATEFSFFTAEDKCLDVAGTWKRKNLDGLARARMQHIGYVLQTGGLLPFLSVYDNIALSRNGLGMPEQGAVKAVAEKLGIERHLQKYPSQLSVGERQRVSIARAMAHEPSVVIADEPTASLDPINAEEIMGLFTRLAEEKGVTLIVATHEWDRVEELGYRQVKFDITKDKSKGAVSARVSG